MIHVFLVDDQSLLRQGLRALLELEPDLQVVGEAEHGQAALEQLATLAIAASLPNVVLMDLRMPVMDGVAATPLLLAQYPTVKVLVLTTFDEDSLVTAALQGGASGYLLKDTPSEELAQAIRAVQKGYAQFGPGILPKVAAQIGPAIAAAAPPTLPVGLATLTPREQEVLWQIAAGASNKEIAAALFISEGTVKNHITHILSRLELRDRTQAAIFAHSLRSWHDHHSNPNAPDRPA